MGFEDPISLFRVRDDWAAVRPFYLQVLGDALE